MDIYQDKKLEDWKSFLRFSVFQFLFVSEILIDLLIIEKIDFSVDFLSKTRTDHC
ncbi:hypothetical protein CU019_2568 [Enterococcus faecium]|nr:hypothetical protein [Enterococcus faecium]MBL5001650.1 hypothetical protein [Enterococcus lactis]MBK4764600.1 hypothetical protein [Enterococcus faecium]MBK4791644.1 hypothetical protein [Enterococcus faecium]MBK4794479.1 hypothetical protein [Enterococcus faecium]